MTLPSSGTLSFSEIETEFGSNGNRSMSRYRANSIHFSNKTFADIGRITEGGYLPLDDGIPRTGTIKFSDFHGKSLNVVVNCWSADGETVDAKSDKWDANDVSVVGGYRGKKESGSKIIIHVNRTFKSVNSTSANLCALKTGNWSGISGMRVDLGDEARLYGAGGHGGAGADGGNEPGDPGQPGNSGLGIQVNNTTVNIKSGAQIKMGYGGGGGGGSARDEDPGADRTAGGGGGGGGAGLPGGEGGSGGTEGSDSGNSSHSGGGGGSDGDTPAGGEESGGGGSGGNNDGEAVGGSGGRGGDQENAAGTGGDSNKGEEGGSAGGNGSAIRKANDEIAYTFSESGSETGGTANTGSESGGSHIGVA